MRLIDADALEELFREVIGGIAKRPEINGNLEHMIRASAMVVEMIKDAPTIEPEPHWIPCSERLPELDDEVLVTDNYDCIRHCVFCKRGETWRGFVTYEEGMTIDAIAWQPLPSPYQEEGEQDE